MILERISLLPDDIIREIYKYIRVLPFDKKEFIHYYETKVLRYHIKTPRFYELPHFSANAFFNDREMGALIGHNKNNNGYFLLLVDTPFSFQFLTLSHMKIKIRNS